MPTAAGPARPVRQAGPGIRRVEVVANVSSGGVDPKAPAEIEAILAACGVDAHVCAPEAADLTHCIRRAVDAAPDLLVILAGDGTARAAAQLCGCTGPLIAPLPGGTMNLLPHALYGARPWQEALRLALEQGEARKVGGGEVEGHGFLVSAVLGSPARWALAREAVRAGRARLAWTRGRRALRQMFTGPLHFALEDGPLEQAEALVFMGPLASRALEDSDQALEAAAFNVRGAGELVRLGFRALLGDWREDPSVETRHCRRAIIRSRHAIPAIVDGEPVRLSRSAEVVFRPSLARVLALPEDL